MNASNKILKTLFRTDGQLELTLMNTENEVTVPPQPSFVFYHLAENMPQDAEYVTVKHKDFLDRCFEMQGYRRKKQDK